MTDEDLDYLLFLFESSDQESIDDLLEDLSLHEEIYALYLERDSDESEQFSEDNIIGYARLETVDLNRPISNPWNDDSYLEIIAVYEPQKRCIIKQTILNS